MVFVHIIIFIIAVVALIMGSDYFVKSAAAIAEKIGVSEFMIGLTLVAVGTSLPELAASIVAAVNHETSIIIGNIVDLTLLNNWRRCQQYQRGNNVIYTYIVEPSVF